MILRVLSSPYPRNTPPRERPAIAGRFRLCYHEREPSHRKQALAGRKMQRVRENQPTKKGMICLF